MLIATVTMAAQAGNKNNDKLVACWLIRVRFLAESPKWKAAGGGADYHQCELHVNQQLTSCSSGKSRPPTHIHMYVCMLSVAFVYMQMQTFLCLPVP